MESPTRNVLKGSFKVFASKPTQTSSELRAKITIPTYRPSDSENLTEKELNLTIKHSSTTRPTVELNDPNSIENNTSKDANNPVTLDSPPTTNSEEPLRYSIEKDPEIENENNVRELSSNNLKEVKLKQEKEEEVILSEESTTKEINSSIHTDPASEKMVKTGQEISHESFLPKDNKTNLQRSTQVNPSLLDIKYVNKTKKLKNQDKFLGMNQAFFIILMSFIIVILLAIIIYFVYSSI